MEGGGEGLDAFGHFFGDLGQSRVLLQQNGEGSGLIGDLDLAQLAGVSEVLAMQGIGLGMRFITVGLSGLGQEDERGGVGCLKTESEVQQDEGVGIKRHHAQDVQGDPPKDDECLGDEKERSAEESGKFLREQGKTILPKDRTEMPMLMMKTKVMIGMGRYGCRCKRGRFHGNVINEGSRVLLPGIR